MLFMIIERYKNRDADAVYHRFRECGRMMPAGLNYLDSWVELNYDRCFQLVSCDRPDLIQEWISHWDDLVDFEIIPVLTSQEATERVENQSS
jgi:hypothetical protein